jgi:hypothetical protein
MPAPTMSVSAPAASRCCGTTRSSTSTKTRGIDPRKVPCADACAVTEVPTAEEIVARFPDPPMIEHRAQPRAFYRPATDSVTMPLRTWKRS